MIYNLINYLATQLTTLTFVANGWSVDSEKESILVRQTGGEPKHWYDRTDWSVQIMSRAASSVNAKKNIELVYAKLKNRYGLTLSSVTVNGEVFDAVIAYQISPIQAPSYIGADDVNLEMWSFNVMITTT